MRALTPSFIQSTQLHTHSQSTTAIKQLDVCLVYLDESHTRGTDLKLPRDYRAAVTLGANLTKDRLVQACMRMRKLGKGQSVAFLVPQEISTKINDQYNRQHGAPIGVDDVLCWSIGETWLDLAKSMPLWAIQGRRFEEHKNLLHGACTPVKQAEKFLEAEAWEIEDRYKPHAEHCAQFEGWGTSNDNIARIISRCQALGVGGLGPAGLQEEQERELSPEIEEEKQVERPAKMDAARHRIHPHLETLISTGKLSTSDAFKPAFQALSTTSAAKLFELAQFPSDMLVTTDFMRTVKTPSGSPAGSYISDPYQRPVQWVLSILGSSSASIQKLVILSPYEVNHLLADIKHSATITLHIFSPRFNASFSSLDRLDLYNSGRNFAPGSIAQSVTMQLNLFAGSLYLQSMEEYSALCDALGLLRNQATDGQRVFPDGFIDPPKGRWGFRSSPVPFLRALLMKVRKEGEGVEKTHLGKILSGLRLEENDFS
ncbi:hypothetical protein BS50DRAFT_682614 [Corynespora cassiicola Philippines]|uniref:ubiquitinyl hydrolase 1 n=1 Tax=Corynespora cassiicola Philippines TaxID=1448308 RepID=A0A2T2N0D1_CORCC|nr:hypothetical protein BS50DRAFT_682614 [Corynespora cassiicola Philippines]